MKLTNHLDANKNEIRNAAIQVLNADPGSPAPGQVYFNSTVKRLRQWNDDDGIWQDYLTSADIANLATQTYVNNAVQEAVAGLNWKDSVRAATTANLDLTGDETIDGIDLDNGDRVLVKNQTDASENGIYVVNTGGAWTRATDADSAADLRGAAVFVEEGTTNADRLYTLTTDNVVLDTTDLTWTQFSAGGGGGSMESFSSATHGAGTTISIPYATHGVGAGDQALDVTVLEVSTGEIVLADVTISAGGDVTVTFSSAVGANAYRVTIHGG